MFGKSLNIGSVTLSAPTVLAPMSGITVSPFRRLLRMVSGPSLGLVVTPLISSEGLVRGNERSLAEMAFRPEERPLAVQIFGRDPGSMSEAALMAEAEGADLIDINAGCPAPRVVRGGGGADLMREPDAFEKVVAAVVKAVQVPVTVKMRSGWDATSINAVELARRAEAVGVSAVTVHGRTRRQGYKGHADWELIRRVASAVSVPVIASGDVTSPQRLFGAVTADDGLSGVMVGRGVMKDPWLFLQAACLDDGSAVGDNIMVRDALWRSSENWKRTATYRCPKNHAALLRLYLSLAREDDLSERLCLFLLRALASSMIRGMPGAANLRRNLGGTIRPEDVIDLADKYFGDTGSTHQAAVA